MQVFVDQDWVDKVANQYGSYAAAGIIAHEWGHIVQGEVPSGVATELQADCLAGAYLRWIGVPDKNATEFFNTSFYFGGGDHGTGTQRANAARQGFNGMIFAQNRNDIITRTCPYGYQYPG